MVSAFFCWSLGILGIYTCVRFFDNKDFCRIRLCFLTPHSSRSNKRIEMSLKMATFYRFWGQRSKESSVWVEFFPLVVLLSKVPAFRLNHNKLLGLHVALFFLLTTCYLLSRSISSQLKLPKVQDIILKNIQHSCREICVQKLINIYTKQERQKER